MDNTRTVGSVPTADEDADLERVMALTEQLLEDFPPGSTESKVFLGAQFDAGLAWVHFSEGNGGLGLRPGLQSPIQLRLLAADAPVAYLANPIGHGMGAPTVFTHGSTNQRKRYLRPLFTGEELWCQLFSEPGAGSDVAGLETRAVLDGDEWTVNGQKVWTTLGHVARWGMLLARTDPQAPKHKGMSYFVIDLHQPGVEVRPLRQITGEAEFNEVYFTNARIPDAERLSEIGDGWRVALTTLMNERVAIGGATPPRGSGLIRRAVRLWNEQSEHRAVDRDRLVRLWIEAEVLRLTNIRSGQLRTLGTPGPEGSIGKLAMAELNKRIGEFVVDALGAEGMLYGDYTMVQPDMALGLSGSNARVFLRTRANSIEGGTTEVMRNILGERVLGLPGEPRTDRSIPWSDVPRN